MRLEQPSSHFVSTICSPYTFLYVRHIIYKSTQVVPKTNYVSMRLVQPCRMIGCAHFKMVICDCSLALSLSLSRSLFPSPLSSSSCRFRSCSRSLSLPLLLPLPLPLPLSFLFISFSSTRATNPTHAPTRWHRAILITFCIRSVYVSIRLVTSHKYCWPAGVCLWRFLMPRRVWSCVCLRLLTFPHNFELCLFTPVTFAYVRLYVSIRFTRLLLFGAMLVLGQAYVCMTFGYTFLFVSTDFLRFLF